MKTISIESVVLLLAVTITLADWSVLRSVYLLKILKELFFNTLFQYFFNMSLHFVVLAFKNPPLGVFTKKECYKSLTDSSLIPLSLKH